MHDRVRDTHAQNIFHMPVVAQGIPKTLSATRLMQHRCIVANLIQTTCMSGGGKASRGTTAGCFRDRQLAPGLTTHWPQAFICPENQPLKTAKSYAASHTEFRMMTSTIPERHELTRRIFMNTELTRKICKDDRRYAATKLM